MFLHLGGNVVVPLKNIISIIDVATVLKSKDSKAFFQVAKEEGFIKNISDEEPKSYIITEEIKKKDRGNGKIIKTTIYTSPISSITLLKRASFIDGIVAQ